MLVTPTLAISQNFYKSTLILELKMISFFVILRYDCELHEDNSARERNYTQL